MLFNVKENGSHIIQQRVNYLLRKTKNSEYTSFLQYYISASRCMTFSIFNVFQAPDDGLVGRNMLCVFSVLSEWCEDQESCSKDGEIH
jgi:hypothetical protein